MKKAIDLNQKVTHTRTDCSGSVKKRFPEAEANKRNREEQPHRANELFHPEMIGRQREFFKSN
jgi:TFIIF-interacting CTD phosphatase-like protein